MASEAISLNDNAAWYPQPGPQFDAYTVFRPIPELFFGGAKMGGKSDYLIGDFAEGIKLGKNWQGIIIRQSMPELEEIIRRTREVYPALGGEYKEGRHVWEFDSGAVLRLRYLETIKDFYKYNGHSFTWIGVDEIGQWSSLEGYHMLKGCLRWAATEIPNKRIRATGNPGGPGHTVVCQYFKLLEYPMGYTLIEDESMLRVFVPSRVQDNKIGLANDPDYILRLQQVGSPELVNAWLKGDWTQVTGAFFKDPLFICSPFEIPKDWLRFRSFDWGSAKPFSAGWQAVSPGAAVKLRGLDGELREVWLPNNCIVRYREWYGAKSANVGLKMTAREVGRGIKERTIEDIQYSVADPSIFVEDGGPSIAEEMRKEGVVFRPADNKRPPGWEQMRMRNRGDADGNPMLVVFSTCRDLIRTYPTMQHDRHKPEDLDSSGEDHAVDELRYGLMSRPWSTEIVPPKPRGQFLASEILKSTLKPGNQYQRF